MMPLQSSGIIVVEKPKTAVTTTLSGSAVTTEVAAATVNVASQQSHQKLYQTQQLTTKATRSGAATSIGKYFEYYGTNDVHQPQQQQQHHQKQQQQQQQQQQQYNVAGSKSNTTTRSQTQLPLMRRAQQRNSSNSLYSSIKCNSNTTITEGTASIKIKQINVKQQQQQQQQQQHVQMNQQQQQHQLIQHTTIHQQQHQIHQQQSQQLATQLQQQHQSKQQQHVQKQHQLPQQQMHSQQQQQQQHHQQQPQPQPQQQVIQVSEEFIEQATASGATNMMISATTGEVLNPQIFKIVATDGTTGNMIIDSGSAAAVGGQSKVLLSNLTVLAKQAPTTPSTSTATTVAVGAAGNLNAQQQHTIGVSSSGTQPQQAQTINYMSAKNLSYLTTAAAAATPITGGGKTQKYTVTGTYKTGVKQQPQQLTSTTYIQQSQQQTNQTMSQGSQQTQQLYQKLSVPRHVQMLTRVQTVVQQPSASGTSMTTNTAAQQQQQTQMLVQPVVGGHKYLSSSATTKSVSVTGTTGNMLKKSNNLKISHSNSKAVNNIQMQQQQGVKTTYITQQTQQQYQLHQPQYQSSGSSKIKTSKLLKQYNNMINNSSSSSGINMLQQQPLGTYTISSSGGAHKLQQTTKVTKMTSNKYATHQQQLQHVATLPQGTHLHHKTVPQQQQQFSTGSNVVTLATSGSGGSSNNNQTINVTNTAGSTIKFVNSTHATVIQQHQTTSLPMQHSKVSLRQQQTQQQQQQIQFVDAPTTTIVKDNSTGNTIYQQQAQSGNNNNSVNTQSLLNDDIMIVNGTQMTDELSARILQSMAQKSFSNHQRYQQQQQTKSVAMPPPNAQQTQQQQQIVLQQHPSPTSVLLSPKEYPVYSTAQLSAQQQTGQQQQLSAPTTINTQYTTAVHQTPTSATAYLPVSAAAHTSSAGSGALYSTISTSGASIGRQTHSAPGSRTHSLERNKSYEASTTITRKTAVDYYKANNNNVGGRGHHHSLHASHATPALSSSLSNIPLETQQQQQQQQQHSSAQIIHLQTLKSSLAATTAAVAAGNSSYTIATNNSAANNTAAASANADDEDIIGEEVRPVPVNTQDLRLRILHAVQQDHTYANAMPSNLSGADNVKSGGGVSVQQLGKVGIGGAGSNSAILPGTATQSHLQSALAGNVGGSQQWSLGGIGVTVASSQTGLGNVLPTLPSSGQSTYTLHGQQIPRVQQDDDAHSAISNGSRVATGDIDPGEETETAPEAEAEDDSVTRCICDLTHDDGYMICCDKCFAWQHVDCMGIDRQNIPDEYQCEVCQPRQVDKARARALQLMKRKEQTQLLLSAQSAHATGSSGAYLGGGASGGGAIMVGNYQLADGQQRHIGGGTSGSFMLGSGGDGGTIHGLPNNTTLSSTKKGKVLKKTSKDTIGGKKSKKADKLGVGSNLGGKPPRKESATAKKTTKRKTKSSDGLSASASAAEKHAANLRQWIENYELAVTNHYSPELRARLHAITKQPSLLQSILNTENRALKECCNNGLENRATTVPHAGGKILISNMDISPSCPIFELRGKYMLSPQYKTQNASVNMNSPPPSNYLAASLKAHKTPGPFIFFYQLPDAEAPMQTMNQDGSYPPLPPQPAYLKGPEICVDTRTYGNEARFVRRSCRPNAEIQHLFEKGTIHLFIVATTRIRASTEITIKHEPHDLLAIENKKATSSNCIVQPTSTACACGLLKDCLFGPPPTQQSLAAGGVSKSSSRKSLLSTTLNGGVQLNSSAAAMQLTMGGLPPSSNKKKGPAQNINRNRSTSSSGDSGIGAAAGGMNSPSVALPAAPLNMNTNVSNHTFKSNGGLNILSGHALATSTAVPNSNGSMSATSSVSSVMHDSGICTSSSSPSVSIPSPSTLHIHSPTQQQSQQQTVVPASTGMQRGSNALFIQHSPQQQQQHQQILGALPTPLLLSPPQQLAHPQGQAQALTQSQVQPQQQQQHTVVDAVEHNINAPLLQEVVTAETTTVSLSQTASQPEQQSSLPMQQLPEQQKHEQQLNQQQMQSEPVCSTVSDASLAAAAALQSLNTAVTLTEVVSASEAQSTPPSNTNNMAIAATEATTPDTFDVSDAEQQPKQPHQQTQQQQQQTQFYVTTLMQPPHQDMVDGSMQEALQQQTTTTTSQLPPPLQSHGAVVASPNSGSKSPQKLIVNTSGIGACLPSTSARIHKTSGKSSSSRSTSFSEDDHQQQQPQHNTSSGSVNDDAANTPTSKEKTKLSREERKMEAILRAIEKMERNQQRKNQQSKSGGTASSSAAKRRNSNSNSPTTPTKRIVGELSASSNSGRVSAAAARKKKRKTHKAYSGHSAQARKRRKSRINSSNESADGAGSNGAGLATTIDTSAGEATLHSETESASLLSPVAPLAATGPSYQPQQEHNEVVADTAASTNEDQAAGLLLAFANPNLKMSPTSQKSPQVSSTTVQQQQQQFPTHYSLEQLKSPQHRTPTGGGNGASPPATPVSSACLLIEAAVGPLQEHMDGSPSGEFKYPNKTKTKKVLMSNWLLNQVDADTSGSDSPPPSAPTPPPSGSGVDVVPAVAAAEVPTATATLGLDSLVQAATMCDYSKQQPEADATFIEQVRASPISVDEPQNLSMAAQKVEEFIQQTERSSSGVYNQTTAAAGIASPRSLLHLPLQVSTCSNNSSVKKRWLRQAISEETTTDESMTPTPTAMTSGSLQNVSPTTAAAAAHLNAVLNVPNGFTTPLKKRRLILSGGEKEEEDAGAPSTVVFGVVKTELPMAPSATEREATKMLPNAVSSDVDVMNIRDGDTNRGMKHEVETSDDEEADEEEYDEEEERDDVDVVGGVGVNELNTTTKTLGNTGSECHPRQEIISKAEQEEVEEQRLLAAEEMKSEHLLIDQDDDVDILRSPSPGHQQMLAAEDNLVKIEPEDTSGGDDVKIDVEREESLAGDKFEELVLMQVKKEETELAAAEQTITNASPSVVKETKMSVEEDEKTVKHAKYEESVNTTEEKFFGSGELDEKVRQCGMSIKLESSHQDMDTTEPVDNKVNLATYDEEMWTAPTEPSALDLLALECGSTASCDEPLKKRPKLEPLAAMSTETSVSSEGSQQTSLLKPLSARMLEMQKQTVNSESANNIGNNNKILQTADTLHAAIPKMAAQFTSENFTPTTQVPAPETSPVSALTPQPNCITFLAAAAAAAIERKPPPPPPDTTATTTPVTTQSIATTAPVCDNIKNALPLSPPLSVTSTAADIGSTGTNTSSASLLNCSDGSSASITLAPRKQNTVNNNNNNERKIPLTDDDIHARLHSFHKENILILQSRNNKKSKPNATSVTTIDAESNKSGKLVENKSLSATGYSSHHSHHHSNSHNDAVKSVSGNSSKHSSASKSFTNSSSSGSSSAKKLRKKERNGKEHSSSSSCRSSSSHSGKLSATNSSSKKVSSSHKKDYSSSTPVSISKQPHSGSSSYNNSNSSSTASGGGDSKDREERRDRDNRERGFDKERHHRHRTTSSSNSSNSVLQSSNTASSTTPVPPPPTSKKRQLNFEQELTKDLPLVNAVTSSSSRHRKDSGSRDSRDDMISSSSLSGSNNNLAARKRRESSSSSGGGSRHRHNSSSSCGAPEPLKDTSTHKPPAAEHNGILAVSHVAPLPPATYVREHVTIPHFNNVVVTGPPPPLIAAYFSGIGAVAGSNVDASMGTPIATYVPTPALPPSSNSVQQPTHSLLKTLPMQPALSHLAAAVSHTVHAPPPLPPMPASSGGSAAVLPPPSSSIVGGTTIPLATHSPGAAGSLPSCGGASTNSTASTYNSIYGKLRDNIPAVGPSPAGAATVALSGAAGTPCGITPATVQAGVSANISLSEYLDTKVKSYSTTMGAYATQSHTYISGSSVSSNTGLLQGVNKPTNNSTSSNSSGATENISVTSTPIESPVVSKLPTSLKLPLTRTASHDPRLNPQLNAPEPPPAPKRKLSINEYRKRMQLSTDSTTLSMPDTPATVSAPTTPAANMTPNLLNNSFVQAYNSIVNTSPEEMARQLSLSPITVTLNKYTLNSPERRRHHSGSEKEQHSTRHSASYDDVVGLLNSSTGSSSCGNMTDTSSINLNNEDDGKKGQFSAAPTLLEKQQEKLCERLKLLRNMNKSVTSLSSATKEFAHLKKDCDLYANRTNSISSTENLDNCLEEISSSSSSSSSTSRASSRDASPERNCVSTNVCRKYTSTTSSNHKWPHEGETANVNVTNAATPTRDDATVARGGSESAT
ncbi:platelet binding protein GspB [Anastrepha obliqua]|uniref:platelet binding protein GspB n=1 Tax=Anastrepha obliqua TaxID=95512 RepID=UPI002409C0E8|nr:platelet binding protein GspB [Anastrepha obliqua]XP_054732877.1 platelet binding protein GspB [Anastrepha obliqua]XP_054732878.1 platelet binding protein GspB [Anastrepha obliqua]XP_054732879.1 platelet binding protein GspB [Anastrepha obliqua]XP_054732880.1 platelet binding protein GspB [Anastrepha obliqua]